MMLERTEVNARFAHLKMKFKTHYKGSFSYRGDDVGFIVKAGKVFDDYSDAAYHQIDTDEPPEFESVDNWHWVTILYRNTGVVAFESKQERW